MIDKKNSMLGNSVKDFDIIKELGQGSYGTVFLVRSKREMGGKENGSGTATSFSNFMNTTYGFASGSSGSAAAAMMENGALGSTK